MTTTRAAIVESGGAPFTFTDVDLDDPGPDEATVRMAAAGLCHTDLGVASGGLPFPLPGVLGHEGAGIVESTGSAVIGVQPGDHVLLSFTSCGNCRNCRSGHPAYCTTWLPLNLIGGTRPDGTHTISRDGTPIGGHFFGQSSFSQLALVSERSMVRVDPDVPLATIAPLACGVQTGAGAIWNVLQPGPGAAIAVLGAGAVGLSAVIAATLTPATTIIAVDKVGERLELARELGATDVIDAGSEDIGQAIKRITGGAGADGVVETTGSTAVLRSGADALAARGTLVIIGAPPFGSEVALDVNGSETQTFIPVLVKLARDGRLPLDKLITQYRFEDIAQAVSDMTAGKAIKPVLTF